MISNKWFMRVCYLSLSAFVIGTVGSGGKPFFKNRVSALSEGPKEKVTTTFSEEIDLITNIETITVTASPTADHITVTGIQLPDGNIVEDSKASFEVYENGDYNFTVLFEEGASDSGIPDTATEETSAPDISTGSDADLGSGDSTVTEETSAPDISTGSDADPGHRDSELESEMLLTAFGTVSKVSSSISGSIDPTVTPATPPSAAAPPLVTGSKVFTYKVRGLGGKSRTVVQDGYVLDQVTQTIIEYQGTDKELTIPVQIGGIDVLHIGAGVFEDLGIRTVTFPKDTINAANNSKVETIGERAFADNKELYNVVFPNSLRTIGRAAFRGCRGLGAYDGRSLWITIPDSVTDIGEYAFSSCRSLSRVRLSKGMDRIRSYTFENSAISRLEIPSNINIIEEGAFESNGRISFTIRGKSQGQITGAPWGAKGSDITWEINLPDDKITDGTWEYSISQKAVVKYTGTGKTPVVPPSFTKDGIVYPVEKIGEMIFYRSGITAITIPEGVTTIGAQAFIECFDLGRVTLPSTLRSIGEGAFELNRALTSIDLPAGLTHIGVKAFDNSVVGGRIRIPGGVKVVPDNAFNGTKISTLEFEEGVTTLGKFAFTDTEITSITLPASLVYLSDSFHGNSKLRSVTFLGQVKEIGLHAFGGCSSVNISLGANDPGSVSGRPWGATGSTVTWKGGVVLPPPPPDTSKEWVFDRYRKVLKKYLGSAKDVVIPKDIVVGGTSYPVEHLGNSIFSGTSTVPIETIIVPEGVITIGERAFAGLRSLTSVSLPSTITTIKRQAFRGTPKLTSVNLPEGLTLLGEEAFYASAVDHVTIPKSLEVIPKSAFENSDLRSITISEGVKRIEEIAFANCSSLERVMLPNSLEKICSWAFTNTPYLRELIIPGRLSYDSIDGLAFKTENSLKIVFLENEKDSVAGAPWGASPASVIVWKDTAYSDWQYDQATKTITGYTGTDTAVVVPSKLMLGGTTYSVDRLGDDVFRNNTTITNVELSLGITSIGRNAFQDAANLRYISIPESIKTVEDGAFENCSSLKEVIFPGVMTSIGADVFRGSSDMDIFLPANGLNSIGGGPWGASGSLVTWKGEEKITSGDWEYSTLSKDVLRYKGTAPVVTIPDTFTVKGRSYPVKRIGYNCFGGNRSIKQAIVPEGVTTIRRSAFWGSTLTGIDLPDSLTQIEPLAFDLSALASIDFPVGLKYIGRGAFEGCVNLTSVVLPPALEIIEREAFYGCTSLVNVTVPPSVNTVSFWSFKDCTALKEIRLPGVKTIAGGAFDGSTALTDIYLKNAPKNSIPGAPWGAATATVHWQDDVIMSDDREWVYSISKKRVTKYLGKSSVISVPEYIVEGPNRYLVTGIDTETFDTKKDIITGITLPKSLQYIMDSVFEGCVNLTTVDLSSGLEWIGASAFKGCTSLTDIKMEGAVQLKEIGASAFEATKLTTISIPDSVVSVGESAFQNCTELDTVYIGSNRSGVTRIGSNAFLGCAKLREIHIKQVITETDIYKNQPWGAPNTTFVKYIGENIVFDSYITKVPNSYERRINIWGGIEKGFIKNVVLPGNTTVDVGKRMWGEQTKPNEVIVALNGSYVFKGFDGNLEETTYVVEVHGIGVPKVIAEDARITLEQVKAATDESVLRLVKARGIADNDKPLPVILSEAELNKVKALSNYGDRATISLMVTDPDPSSGMTAARDVTLTLSKRVDPAPDSDVEPPTPPTKPTPPVSPTPLPDVPAPSVPAPDVLAPDVSAPSVPDTHVPGSQQVGSGTDSNTSISSGLGADRTMASTDTSGRQSTVSTVPEEAESEYDGEKSGAIEDEENNSADDLKDESEITHNKVEKDGHGVVEIHNKTHWFRFVVVLIAFGLEYLVLARRKQWRDKEDKRK